jgi:hypothetical protein
MFWDYESDTTGTLLDAVNAGLRRTPPPIEVPQLNK